MDVLEYCEVCRPPYIQAAHDAVTMSNKKKKILTLLLGSSEHIFDSESDSDCLHTAFNRIVADKITKCTIARHRQQPSIKSTTTFIWLVTLPTMVKSPTYFHTLLLRCLQLSNSCSPAPESAPRSGAGGRHSL